MSLGDESPTRIVGCGIFKLKLKDGRTISLPGVLHIPNLVRNLISIGKMDFVALKTVYKDGGCKMVRGSMVLMRGVWYGNLYKLLGKPSLMNVTILL